MKTWKRICAVFAMLVPPLLTAQTPDAAIALQHQGKLAESAVAWRAVTQRNPKDAAAFAAWGSVLSQEGKYEDAVPAYRKALGLNPKLPGIQLNLGIAQFKPGHFAQAITPLRAALAADPKSAQAQALLGLSFYGASRFQEAVAQLKPAANEILPIPSSTSSWRRAVFGLRIPAPWRSIAAYSSRILIRLRRICSLGRRSMVWEELRKRLKSFRRLPGPRRASLT